MENIVFSATVVAAAASFIMLLLLSPDYTSAAYSNNTGLFVFGDSIFDPGNNNNINNNASTIGFRANYFPYGETFFKHPTGRFSNGRLIPDFIAEFAHIPLIPPYFKNGHNNENEWAYNGVNFASGGSGALVETRAGSVIDLKTQLSYFKNVDKGLISKLGKKEAKRLLSSSVYLFSVGGNDLMGAPPPPNSPSDYVNIVIGNVTQVIKELHRKGARKFGFVNVIPLGCLPFFRVSSGVNIGQCNERITSLTKLYNAALAQRLEDLQKSLKGFYYSLFDSYIVLMDMIDNPSKYGFEEGKRACCGIGIYRGTGSCGGMRGIKEYELCKDPKKNVFFDSFHPSEHSYRILAKMVWHGVPNITMPFNLKSLFYFSLG